MYIMGVDKKNDGYEIEGFYRYDIGSAGDKLEEIKPFPDVADGNLGIFRGKLTLFGGKAGNDGSSSYSKPAVKTMQVYNELLLDWTEKPFEFKNIRGYSYSVLVEK